MSTVGSALVTWEEFLQMEDPEDGKRYELHDGEVVLVPPARPIHIYIQRVLAKWLTGAAEGRGDAMSEFPYRPAANLQFWYADVAYLSNEDWEIMRSQEYSVYPPPLIVEVLSPSNGPGKIQRQRVAALSAGTREFWVVNTDKRTIEVWVPGSPARIYSAEETIPVTILPGAAFPVAKLFQA
jgi:Uma2 family endonuclease